MILDQTLHTGHPMLERHLRSLHANAINDKEEELCGQMMASGCTDPTAARVMTEHTGRLWTPNQIRHLNKKEERHLSELSPDASSADELIHEFNQR